MNLSNHSQPVESDQSTSEKPLHRKRSGSLDTSMDNLQAGQSRLEKSSSEDEAPPATSADDMIETRRQMEEVSMRQRIPKNPQVTQVTLEDEPGRASARFVSKAKPTTTMATGLDAIGGTTTRQSMEEDTSQASDT